MQSGSKERQRSSFLMLLAGILLGCMLLGTFSVKNVHAETKNGFVTENGHTYYYENGVKHKGWLTIGPQKYYFTKGSGIMATGWLQDSKGRKRYFSKTTGVMATGLVKFSSGTRYFDKSTGIMATGWLKFSGGRRYFDPSTGIMATEWLTVGSNRYYMDKSTGFYTTGFKKIGNYYRYFYSKSGIMARGWLSNSNGDRRYFLTSSSTEDDGGMCTGFTKINGDTYYFKPSNGKMVTGFVSIGGKKYYFYDDGIMAVGTVTIDGTTYEFGSDGALQTSEDDGELQGSTGTKTIKNYLLGALMPVGQALYVWGGGWNDGNRKGLSPAWKEWYDSQSSSYNYENYSDLSVSNRAKGLDCSGFVGWATYQVMQKTSGANSGYTVVSGEVGGYYESLGWGQTINQNYLSNNGYTLKAGDIGYNSNHVWLVIGQCKDKSVVLVHSTPDAGVQIAGTTTPEGGYGSEAAELAKKYMSRYPGTEKYEYYPSVGNYIRQYGFFRWDRSTLADPDGYMSKYADEILADLFS